MPFAGPMFVQPVGVCVVLLDASKPPLAIRLAAWAGPETAQVAEMARK